MHILCYIVCLFHISCLREHSLDCVEELVLRITHQKQNLIYFTWKFSFKHEKHINTENKEQGKKERSTDKKLSEYDDNQSCLLISIG